MTRRSAPPSGHREYELKSSRPLDLTVEEVCECEARAKRRTERSAFSQSFDKYFVLELNAKVESKRLANADRYSTGRVVPGVNGVPNNAALVDPDDFSGGG